ncbi:MAG: alanine--tRNA ligase [bacterium]
MKYLGVNEIRSKYLIFFQNKEHLKADSFSLVPQNDKSLLLINSGMAPLKPYFTGQQVPPSKKMTTCQKCIRTGDIENVGKTARHGTFFEMLGNFSFGDYFKEEAIAWAWEFFIDVMELPEEKLFASVYEEDDEAFKIWEEKVGLDKSKIVKLGKADNFWEHGVGPCGPCSEIYFDKGKEYGCDDPNCFVGCDCDRYMEIWNLVFTQFSREEDGTYSDLANPNIDTGMGLERLATVMQGVNSIFDVDTIKAIRDKVCELGGVKYEDDYKTDISIRVITDHIRAITFMTADGVLPSNEGRGYVLRRLLRRAVRHGKILNINDLFLADLSKIVITTSKDAYSELAEKEDYIYKILTVEEERFHSTIDNGLVLLKDKIQELRDNALDTLKGQDAFKLYDTYGFPLDLMKEILEEENLEIDEEEFLKEMENQKNKARSAREEDTYMGAEETIFNKLEPTMSSEFDGYDKISLESEVQAIVFDNQIVNAVAEENAKVYIITTKTPFYAEMGGQAGDTGLIKNANCVIEIEDCINFGGNKIIHQGVLKSGVIEVGDRVELEVDEQKRLDVCRNHTATHMLHKALKEVLGNHVQQAGSLVTKNRLRFDLTHFEPMTQKELLEVEKIVNYEILKAHDVVIKEMSIEDARKEGAMALFGEKYGDVVRVVNIGGYSIELCGGTHVKNSAQIGSFKIISESGVAAGVRRIEAVAGVSALEFYKQREELILKVCENLKSDPKNLLTKVIATLDDNKKLLKEIEGLKNKLSTGILDEILAEKQEVNNMQVVLYKVSNMDMDSLRNLGDKIKDKLDNYIILLASDNKEEGKVNFITMCSEEAIKLGHKAGDLVKMVATTCGGGGGGRPNMAQAGGKNPEKIEEAFELVMQKIKN